MTSLFHVRQDGPRDFSVRGANGFRFPCPSRLSADRLAERANWNVANGWDWNR